MRNEIKAQRQGDFMDKLSTILELIALLYACFNSLINFLLRFFKTNVIIFPHF
jgi:hypothetical protein